jgi:hypothetical protein
MCKLLATGWDGAGAWVSCVTGASGGGIAGSSTRISTLPPLPHTIISRPNKQGKSFSFHLSAPHQSISRALLRKFHESPDDFASHLRHLAGAIIMEVKRRCSNETKCSLKPVTYECQIMYGIKVLQTGDPYIETAEKALTATSEAMNPGTFLVDSLPIRTNYFVHITHKFISHAFAVKYVPEWMPGASFQEKARIWRSSIIDMPAALFMAVKQSLVSISAFLPRVKQTASWHMLNHVPKVARTAEPSITASLLEELSRRSDVPADEEDVIRDTGAVAYAGGSDMACQCFPTCSQF